jgi:O-Antigen ligase
MTGAEALSLPRSLLLPVTRRWSEIAAAVYGCAVVSIVAGSSGGFLPTTWGWTAVVTLWLAAIALLLRDRIRFRALELAYVGGMLAFTAWVALSNFWTPSVTSTMHEVQRDIAYTGVIAAGILLVRSRAVPQLLGGVLIGIVLDSLYGLGTRLLPDRFGGFDSISYDNRLSAPITYWNGLGIFATIGFLLALAFAVRGRHLVTRALGAAALPLLAATIYFTFSRGAWYALVLGVIAAIAIDPRRLQLLAVSLVLAPWTVFAIVAVRRQHGLVTLGATFEQATHDGHRLIPVLLALAGVSSLAALAAGVVERHVHVPRSVRAVFAAALVLALAVGVAGVWHREGSPESLAKRGWHEFHGLATKGSNGDVGARLTSLSADGRIPLWHVSLRDFEHAPILGQGAGTFWESWARYRTIPSDSTQAHSLYLGVLGELGIVGFLVLLVLVAAPIVAAAGGRARGLTPLTLGAYVAWACHAGIDWDWALMGVTIPALLCGVALLKLDGRPRRSLGRIARIAGVCGFGALLLVAVLVLVADLRLRSAQKEMVTDPSAALARARGAESLLPWSSEPYLVMADAYQQQGKQQAARRSLQQAISKDSSSWLLWQLLANATSGAAHQQAQTRANELNPLKS